MPSTSSFLRRVMMILAGGLLAFGATALPATAAEPPVAPAANGESSAKDDAAEREAAYSRYYAQAQAAYKDKEYRKAFDLAEHARHIKDTAEVQSFTTVLRNKMASAKEGASDTTSSPTPTWLKAIPYKIVYESYRENNWEIIQVNADGSDPVNLTKTPDVSEMYPHVSPDGSKIAFLVNAGKGEATRRSAWFMNYDGTGRTKIADDIRECCWNGDGRTIAMLPAESPKKYVHEDWATHGLTIYDLATGKITPHPNKDLDHLLGLTWSPDSKWFLVTVYGGMGYSHTTLAFGEQSTKVFDLHISGCRPDLTLDGKHLAWGSSVTEISMADIDLAGEKPVLSHQPVFVHAPAGMKVYHVDWSPDGKYVAFSRGPEASNMGAAPEQLGVTAPGWNICVGNVATGECVQITTDGQSNKEPDWVPLKAPAGDGKAK
jgi:WD40-like Beta Propeller Repeat